MTWITDSQRFKLKQLKIKHYKYITKEEAQELIDDNTEILVLETRKDIDLLNKFISNRTNKLT